MPVFRATSRNNFGNRLTRLQALFSTRRPDFPDEINPQGLIVTVPVNPFLVQQGPAVANTLLTQLNNIVAFTQITLRAGTPTLDAHCYLSMHLIARATAGLGPVVSIALFQGTGAIPIVSIGRGQISGTDPVGTRFGHAQWFGCDAPVWIPAGFDLIAVSETALAAGDTVNVVGLIQEVPPGMGPVV